MRKLRSTRRKMAMAAVTLAIGAGATIGTASFASAQVKGPVACTPNDGTLRIWRGSSSQCFYWLSNVPGNYLNVNDWYAGVNAGSFTVQVEWHDVATGQVFKHILNPYVTDNQPTFNSVLWGITFES